LNQVLRDGIEDFVTQKCGWDIALVRIATYTGIACVHVNINIDTVPIEYIARANPKWQHDTEYGKKYDHVMIQVTEEGRLEGSRLARLQLIGRIINPGDPAQERTFLAVQWYDPVEYLDTIRMQSYALADSDVMIIPASNLLRNVHVVPIWRTFIHAERNNPDIYGRYSQFVLNAHADQASYNYFY